MSSNAIVSLTVNPPPDDYGNLPNGTAYALALSGGTKGRGSITGNFELPGDRDVFQITVVKGVLAVALSGIDNLNTYLRVYNSTGTQIGFDDDSGPGLDSALTLSVNSGTYYLSAGSFGDSCSGSYSLEVEHRAQITASFQQGVSGYTNSSDTYISGSFPTTSYASVTMNQIDYTSSSLQEQTLLQFKNLFGSGSGQVPFGAEVQSATLTFYVTNGGNRVNIHRMLAAWSDTVTWNGMVGGIQANGVEATVSPDAQTPLSTATGWLNVDVRSSVLAWLANPNMNFGWALLPTGTDGVDIYSANNSSSWVPRLSIDYLAPNGDLHANTPSSSATPIMAVNDRATVFGTLENAGDRDVFQFTLTQSRTVTLNLSPFGSSVLDTKIRLFDAAFVLLAENDNPSSNSSSLTLTLAPGTYYVSVGSHLDLGLGDYWLDLFL